MYRLAVETLLGITLEVDRLRLTPRVPESWHSFKIHYRYRETFYHIVLKRAAESAAGAAPPTARRATGAAKAAGAQPYPRVVLDGVELHQSAETRGTVPLVDDRRDHQVEVQFG